MQHDAPGYQQLTTYYIVATATAQYVRP